MRLDNQTVKLTDLCIKLQLAISFQKNIKKKKIPPENINIIDK